MLLPPLHTQQGYVDLATTAGFSVLGGPKDISKDVAQTWYASPSSPSPLLTLPPPPSVGLFPLPPFLPFTPVSSPARTRPPPPGGAPAPIANRGLHRIRQRANADAGELQQKGHNLVPDPEPLPLGLRLQPGPRRRRLPAGLPRHAEGLRRRHLPLRRHGLLQGAVNDTHFPALRVLPCGVRRPLGRILYFVS